MPTLLTLQCPSCGGRTRFSSGADRFTCDYCGNQHLLHLPMAGGAPVAPNSERSRALRPRPKAVTVTRTSGGGLRFSWRWFSPKYIGLAVFCVAWDAFLCFWYGVALNMPSTPWIMVVFPIGHLAVGVCLTYTTLAGFINRTTVTLDGGRLTVHHDPAPWFGEVNEPLGALEQLFCKETRQSGENGDSFSYQLCAALKDGREIKLVSNLDSPDLARYLEQEIETRLMIEDRPVLGSI